MRPQGVAVVRGIKSDHTAEQARDFKVEVKPSALPLNGGIGKSKSPKRTSAADPDRTIRGITGTKMLMKRLKWGTNCIPHKDFCSRQETGETAFGC